LRIQSRDLTLLFVYDTTQIDYYNNPQLRRSYPGYDIFAYTKQWADFGGQVADLFSKESHAPKFQIGAYVDYPNYVWTVPATLGTGVLDTKAGKNMDKFCAHNYQVRVGVPLSEICN
jgi:hypothetical protein